MSYPTYMETMDQHSSAGARILLVDDDALLREIASCNLEQCGYDVVMAANGREAVEHLRGNKFDLLISDIEMPEMDGLELTKFVRHSEAHTTIPILIITGKDQSQSVDEAYMAGATSFLAKPINWELFTRSVKFVLQSAQAQKELRIAKDMALSAVRLKQAILSNLTHEMRTPLNHIMGFADVLTMQNEIQDNEQLLSFIEKIQTGGDRMLELIQDMLFLSEAEAGPIPIKPSIFTPDDIIQKMYALYEADAKSKNMTIKLYGANEPLSLSLDQALLQRVLANLLSNAIKFSPKGSEIQFGTMLNKTTGRPLFFVKDQGPGVPLDKIQYLGKSFEQVDMRRNRRHDGMGLGLKICKLIATAFEGQMTYQNAKDGGLMAAICLPSKCLLQSELSPQRLIA